MTAKASRGGPSLPGAAEAGAWIGMAEDVENCGEGRFTPCRNVMAPCGESGPRQHRYGCEVGAAEFVEAAAAGHRRGRATMCAHRSRNIRKRGLAGGRVRETNSPHARHFAVGWIRSTEQKNDRISERRHENSPGINCTPILHATKP